MRLPAIGARLRKVAQVLRPSPPADQKKLEHERMFRELQRHESEMSARYLATTQIDTVRTYQREMLFNAKRVQHNSLGFHWICGHCKEGDLGFNPHTGDHCPQCAARIEEVLRRPIRSGA